MIVLPRRLSDEVADRVRALFDEKNLEAGMKLPAERQLAMQHGVSRNSLREALAKLVSEPSPKISSPLFACCFRMA
ncbi:GntR family transcriptional regulator, partial [Escherichia coli]|nr:GntR family transcriptional regulator [Escherichia coli]